LEVIYGSIYLSSCNVLLSVGYGCPHQRVVFLPGGTVPLGDTVFKGSQPPFKKKRIVDGVIKSTGYD
jgi:hypothetical protein